MVELIGADPNRERKMLDMYTEVAKGNRTSHGAVERGIRHAISRVDKESEAWRKYIGAKDATNAVVLCILAHRLKED